MMMRCSFAPPPAPAPLSLYTMLTLFLRAEVPPHLAIIHLPTAQWSIWSNAFTKRVQ